MVVLIKNYLRTAVELKLQPRHLDDKLMVELGLLLELLLLLVDLTLNLLDNFPLFFLKISFMGTALALSESSGDKKFRCSCFAS